MSSSPTPEGHRPEPSQSSLLERDWEWLVWEGRTCCCRVEQLSVCATVDTLPYLCRLFYFYFALFIADRTTFVTCCCTQITNVFILSPSFFCLLLLSYCSLLNKHPPSPSMCILPRYFRLYVYLRFFLHGFCFTFPSASANISVISYIRYKYVIFCCYWHLTTFQVLLGEVNMGLNTTQVVVKELKSSANVQDQMHFLEEAQPYRYVSFCCIWVWSHFCPSDGKRTWYDLRSWTCGTKSNLCNREIFIFPILKMNNNLLKFFPHVKRQFSCYIFGNIFKIHIMIRFHSGSMESIYAAKSQSSYINWLYPDT